jgi:hypothetical protein
VEKDFELVGRFFQGIGMVMESTVCFNVQVVDRWTNFESSQINDSTKRGRAVGFHGVVVNFSRQTMAPILSEDGKVAILTKAEGTLEEIVLDLNDTEAFQDERTIHVADLDLESQSNHS